MRDLASVGTYIQERRRNLSFLAVAVIVAVAVGIAILASYILNLTVSKEAFTTNWFEGFAFGDWVNSFEDFLRSYFRWLTRGISGGIEFSLDKVETLLFWLPWPVVLLAVVLPALKFAGLRLALFCVGAVTFWGVVDMWDSAMKTLALMGVSVFFSVIIGVSLGIIAARSDTIEAIIRPVLDAMQTMPGFVYLIPAILFFGIGGPPAVAATVIYALPPAVRLTNLGIRQVSPEAVEAARSFGSTPLQTLVKVQLPLATPSIMMGINQTVMMALGLVVIAALIGAAGLGYEVWQALRHINVGWSFEGGLAIVFMAVMFDRIGYAMSSQNAETVSQQQEQDFKLLPNRLERFEFARAFERGLSAIYDFFYGISQLVATGIATVVSRIVQVSTKSEATEEIPSFFKRHSFLVTGVAIILILLIVDGLIVSFSEFPSSWRYTLRGPIDSALDWLKVNGAFVAFTTWIRATVFIWLLDPLSSFLEWLPLPVFISSIALIAWAVAGRRVAALSVIGLLFIVSVGLWNVGMDTLTLVLVSVFLCAIIGIPLGILASRNDTFEGLLRPILDAMQTMPAFVYLVPVVMFFGGNVVSGVIATVIYAVPPTIRLTNLGIRQVSPEVIEAARSYGSTSLQTLVKVQMPLALPSIMMGINQAVMMALAMVAIVPLIGAAGLGLEVFRSISLVDTGRGFEAGLSIVFMAVIMDRITQAWSKKRQEALNPAM
ncbi:MAG: ABC transporter permease subunit [Dehalococcoidia bacterium]